MIPAAGAAAQAGGSRAPASPIVIDTEAIVAQAREAARDAAREAREHARDAQRHVLEMQEHMKDMELDLATMAFVQSELGGRTEIVKNAPYTAEAVSESVQTLSDGNRIVKQTRTLIARDSLGRTRQEKKSAGGKTTVYVFDPIEGKNFAMNPERKTAVRIPRVPAPPIPPIPPIPPVPPLPGVAPVPPVPPVPGVAPNADARIAIEPGRVIVRRGRDGEGRRGRARSSSALRRRRRSYAGFADRVHAAAAAARQGRNEVDGDARLRRRQGRRHADDAHDPRGRDRQREADRHHHRALVLAASCTWSCSPGRVDPRVGETSYRLANLKREEPSADLFKVPADYKTRR